MSESRSPSTVLTSVALIRSYEINTQYLFTDLESLKPPTSARPESVRRDE